MSRNAGFPQGTENRGAAPREMVYSGEIRALADDPEDSWVAVDESLRMEERSALDNKTPNGTGESSDLDLDKPLRIRLPRRRSSSASSAAP
jgi:hypothetical protein